MKSVRNTNFGPVVISSKELGYEIAPSGLARKNKHTWQISALRSPLMRVIQRDNVQQTQMLPFIFVQAFDQELPVFQLGAHPLRQLCSKLLPGRWPPPAHRGQDSLGQSQRPTPRLGVNRVRVARENAPLQRCCSWIGFDTATMLIASRLPQITLQVIYLTAPVHPIDWSFDVSCVGSLADVVPPRSLPLCV
jgi:hypothetical protein